MHSHRLHYPVDVPCHCCRMENQFVFGSRHDVVVCKACERHQGSSPNDLRLRDKDHVALWSSELELAKEQHARRLAARQAEFKRINGTHQEQLEAQRVEIEDLRHAVRVGVERSPAVERWLADEHVRAADEKRDAAYRSRDHAYRALLAADDLHHADEGKPKYCCCGEREPACKEMAALKPVAESLRRWEYQQIERLKQGKSDGLPDDHPQVLRYGRRDHHSWRRRTG